MTSSQKKRADITTLLIAETPLSAEESINLAIEFVKYFPRKTVWEIIQACEIPLNNVPEAIQKKILSILLRKQETCIYCHQPVEDTSFTVDEDGVAHKECYERAWRQVYAEIEAEYQAGVLDWHIVKGKIERRCPECTA